MSPSRIVRPRATTAVVDATVTVVSSLPVRDVVGRAARRPAIAVAGPPGEPAVAPGTSETAARAATEVGATTTAVARAAIVRDGTGRAAARAGARTATGETAPAGPPTHGVGTVPTVAVRGASAVTRRAVRAVSTAERATTGRVPGTVTPGRDRGATVRTDPHGVGTLVAGASSATPRAGVADRADRATTVAAVTVPGESAGATPRAPGPVATATASTDVLSPGTLPARTCPRTCRSPSSTVRRAAGSGR